MTRKSPFSPARASYLAATVTSGQAFAAMDRLLDEARSGPFYLRQPRLLQPWSFWQEESYGHLVRNEREFEKIQSYVDENPVRAGLVREAVSAVWVTRGSPRGRGRGRGRPPHRCLATVSTAPLQTERTPYTTSLTAASPSAHLSRQRGRTASESFSRNNRPAIDPQSDSTR